MLLAINGATTMKATLQEDIAAAQAAGFKAIEIWAAKMDVYLKDHSIEELWVLLDEAGIQPASINSIEFITFRPPDEYETIQARCADLSRLARALGCDKIVVVPSPTPEGVSWNDIRDESVRVLRDLAAIAKPHDVNLAFEFLGFAWCSVRTLAQGWEIVKETMRHNVGLSVDTCHFYAGGSSLQSILEIEAQKVHVFHINDVEERPLGTIEDAHRLLPGEGVIPLDEILIRMKHIGYNGLCSVELFRPEYWERDPVELATAARSATAEIVGDYFSFE